jgi:phosphopantothenoylcysteine decarboxylase/phosphopantothenate--cysteine ligase
MWNHPATRRNLSRLRADGVRVIEPDAGEMACGTVGPGRLSEPERIVAAALDMLRIAESRAERDLAGERILITAGATREEIDPVRFLSNRSSGRMGLALAEAAYARGAGVTVVAGSIQVEPPAGIHVVSALSAEAMRDAVMKEVGNATIFIAAAAVSDYRPMKREPNKIKKSGERLQLTLEPTPDILGEVSALKQNGLLVIGFAAETDDLINHARSKLERKRLDAIVANDVTAAGAGFDAQTNVVTIITRAQDAPLELPLMSKLDASHRILDEIARLRRNDHGE